MIERRLFLRQCGGAALSALLVGCGGGGGDAPDRIDVIAGPLPPPTPTPTPTPTAPEPAPTPTPSPQPTTAIDIAEADLRSAFDGVFQGFALTDRFDDVVIARSPADVLETFEVIRGAGETSFNRRIKIVCDWNGTAVLPTGAATRMILNGPPRLTTGHVDRGGGILIVAAAGKRPAFGNQVEVTGLRGVHFDGIDFFRQRIGDEDAGTAYGVCLYSSDTFPARGIARFTGCRFGARHVDASLDPSRWVSGINTRGLPDYLDLSSCSFSGNDTAVKAAVRLLRADNCDFSGSIGDVFALYSHTTEEGYYAVAWISRCTFRSAPNDRASRNNHRDIVQTCTPADRHLGYRLLLTDLVAHQSHLYAGDPGMGGGSQGFFNRAYPGKEFDNQYIVRRCTVLVASPHGFAYYATRPSRPTFVDQCTFMRCGQVPSSLAGDLNPAQDMAVGITSGDVPFADPMLHVTRCIGMDLRPAAVIDPAAPPLRLVDPRVRNGAVENRPETVFVGRDFTRGARAANFMPEKFGYILPNEDAGRAAFLADVWANFEPRGGHAGIGAPDPRGM